MSEAKMMHAKAVRVLLAAVAEADGKAGEYVHADGVMEEAISTGAPISDEEEFRTIAEYLDEKGYIAEGGEDYGKFVVTPEGVAEAAKYR